MEVHFEDLEVKVTDVISGVATLIEVYWVFDVQYSPENKKTLCVLEHLLGFKHTTLGVLSRRLVTALTKE